MDGERYEALAFNFCKCATLVLILGRFALPVASGVCAILYVIAYFKGKKESRCVMRYPLLIAAFWGTVSILSVYRMLS